MFFEISLFVLCYFIGAIPLSVYITKYFGGVDPRTVGSGNIGFSNTLRNNGSNKLSALIGIIDVSKGLLIGFIASLMPDYFAYALCMGMFGNLFSIFSSGKAVSILIGILIFCNPLFVLIVPIWFVLAKKFYPIIASMFVVIVCLLFILFNLFLLPLLALLSLIVYKHKANINRLYCGEENKL